ncbi:MAG: GNAT family N-acetyltransferase [Candidatus Rokubacteria bacterium]|nr:GNAT family N-acetyltransferase [Candidatus Rokubacteria bacterium]
MDIRAPESGDVSALMELAADVIGPERAGPFIRSHLERHHVLVAEKDDAVVGLLAYRTDWFQCTFVSLVSVTKDERRKGVARALYQRVEEISPSPRLFSSTEETNGISIQMHSALGFVPSGQIDNLPQGYRELVFYKRLRPQRRRAP